MTKDEQKALQEELEQWREIGKDLLFNVHTVAYDDLVPKMEALLDKAK